MLGIRCSFYHLLCLRCYSFKKACHHMPLLLPSSFMLQMSLLASHLSYPESPYFWPLSVIYKLHIFTAHYLLGLKCAFIHTACLLLWKAYPSFLLPSAIHKEPILLAPNNTYSLKPIISYAHSSSPPGPFILHLRCPPSGLHLSTIPVLRCSFLLFSKYSNL